MNQVKRGDVEIDMCPTCRGVWLDRGELEKIIAMERDSTESPRGGADYREDYDSRDRSGRGGHGGGHGSGYRGGRRFSLRDLFD